MKTYEQIARAMYEACRPAMIHAGAKDQVPGVLDSWESVPLHARDVWIAVAKEAAKQFGVVLPEDNRAL